MRLALVLALSLAACAAPDYISVDQRFTPQEAHLIRQAAENWEIATGARIDLVFGERVDTDMSGRTSTLIRTSSRDTTVGEHPLAAGITSRTLLSTRIALFMDVIDQAATERSEGSNDMFLFVVTHEFGHYLLGSGHIRDPKAVMRPSISTGPLLHCITVADTEYYCGKTDGCKMDQMHGC